jgi:hypothetical protein
MQPVCLQRHAGTNFGRWLFLHCCRQRLQNSLCSVMAEGATRRALCGAAVGSGMSASTAYAAHQIRIESECLVANLDEPWACCYCWCVRITGSSSARSSRCCCCSCGGRVLATWCCGKLHVLHKHDQGHSRDTCRGCWSGPEKDQLERQCDQRLPQHHEPVLSMTRPETIFLRISESFTNGNSRPLACDTV